MKKATIFILLGIISCLLLSSCSSTIHPSHDPAELEKVEKGIYIQPDKQNLPSSEDLDKIDVGLRLEEVQELIGYPQRYYRETISFEVPEGVSSGGVMHFYYYIYDSRDGDSITIKYSQYISRNGDFVYVVSDIDQGDTTPTEDTDLSSTETGE